MIQRMTRNEKGGWMPPEEVNLAGDPQYRPKVPVYAYTLGLIIVSLAFYGLFRLVIAVVHGETTSTQTTSTDALYIPPEPLPVIQTFSTTSDTLTAQRVDILTSRTDFANDALRLRLDRIEQSLSRIERMCIR